MLHFVLEGLDCEGATGDLQFSLKIWCRLRSCWFWCHDFRIIRVTMDHNVFLGLSVSKPIYGSRHFFPPGPKLPYKSICSTPIPPNQPRHKSATKWGNFRLFGWRCWHWPVGLGDGRVRWELIEVSLLISAISEGKITKHRVEAAEEAKVEVGGENLDGNSTGTVLSDATTQANLPSPTSSNGTTQFLPIFTDSTVATSTNATTEVTFSITSTPPQSTVAISPGNSTEPVHLSANFTVQAKMHAKTSPKGTEIVDAIRELYDLHLDKPTMFRIIKSFLPALISNEDE